MWAQQRFLWLGLIPRWMVQGIVDRLVEPWNWFSDLGLHHAHSSLPFVSVVGSGTCEDAGVCHLGFKRLGIVVGRVNCWRFERVVIAWLIENWWILLTLEQVWTILIVSKEVWLRVNVRVHLWHWFWTENTDISWRSISIWTKDIHLCGHRWLNIGKCRSILSVIEARRCIIEPVQWMSLILHHLRIVLECVILNPQHFFVLLVPQVFLNGRNALDFAIGLQGGRGGSWIFDFRIERLRQVSSQMRIGNSWIRLFYARHLIGR